MRTKDDRPFTHVPTVTGRRGVLLQWLPGTTAAARSDKAYFSAADLIARMHRHAETFRPGRGFSCRRLDDEWLFGERFFMRSRPARRYANPSARKTLSAAERMVRTAMARLGKSPTGFGLIHADLNLANILFHRGRASPIDFDEFGRGWYLFDLAELSRTSITPDNWVERKQFAIAAYTRSRALDDEECEAFDAFIVATFIQCLNWASFTPATRTI
jgi:Ser/Thr protein kinase RdoA (MazF antagonist)